MKTNPKIAIVDYGVGNLQSITRALKFFDIEPTVSEDAQTLIKADAIILPGVGAFEAGMRGLEVRGLTDTIKKIAGQNKPLLGICLGAQLLLSEGHEFGIFKGLDIIKGKVVKFPSLPENEKIPHIGWNKISYSDQKNNSDPILKNLTKNPQFYFVHSYILEPKDSINALALTDYGGYTFCSMVKSGNIYGCQFHPEKSGLVGLNLIKNFIDLI